MYHYLNSFDVCQFQILKRLNSIRPFNPYRNEDRYKAILRANYLPVPGE